MEKITDTSSVEKIIKNINKLKKAMRKEIIYIIMAAKEVKDTSGNADDGNCIDCDRTTRKSYESISKIDFKIIAPFLWVRNKNKRNNQSNISDISSEIPNFSLNILDIQPLPEQILTTSIKLKELTHSTGVKLYLIDNIVNKIYFYPISSDGDVENGSSKKSTSINSENERISWTIESGKSIAAHVAFAKEGVMVNEIHVDNRFPDGVCWGDLTITSVICIPIIGQNHECVAIIELFRNNGVNYIQENFDIVCLVVGWMSSAIEQYQNDILLKTEDNLNKSLLNLTQHFMANTNIFEHVISEIFNTAKQLINAERCTLYIVNDETNELMVEVFDEAKFESISTVIREKLLKKLGGIGDLAIKMGKLINIKDAHTDSRFDKRIDNKSGFLNRSILCMPILSKNQYIGVIQLINKLPAGGYFNNIDEHLFQIFANYCEIIVNYKKLKDKESKHYERNHVYENLRNLFVAKFINETNKYVPPIKPPIDLLSFSWYPFPKYMDNLIALSHFMIMNLSNGVLDEQILYGFLILVEKNYRINFYHNFEHAFTFLHCVYCILKLSCHKFNLIEILSLLIGGLCHDIDHPGYTNQFLKQTNNTLSTLYEESFLENHHIWITIQLIKHTNLLGNLQQNDADQLLEYLKENILATDLSTHLLQKRRLLVNISCDDSDHNAKYSKFDWTNTQHRILIRGLIMTASDLAGQAKPFRIAQRLTEHISKEFYDEGDLQRSMGLNPLPIMNRSCCNQVPDIQVKFLKIICIPCFELLTKFIPETEIMLTNCLNVKRSWKEIIDSRGLKTWNPENSVTSLNAEWN